MKRIGLALCQHIGAPGKYLFQRPRYSSLKPGDRVIVETKHGEEEASVIESATVYDTDDEYKMLLAATGATLPLKKVLRKVEFSELRYDEEDLAVFEDDDVNEEED